MRIKSAKWDRVNTESAEHAATNYDMAVTMDHAEIPSWIRRVEECLAHCTLPGWRRLFETSLAWLKAGHTTNDNRKRMIAKYQRCMQIAQRTGEFTLPDIDWEKRVARAKMYAEERAAKRPAWMSDPSLLPKKPPRPQI